MHNKSAMLQDLTLQPLIEELLHAIDTVKPFGSVEVYVQNDIVTQITIRKIKKTSVKTHNSKMDKTTTL